VLGGGVEFTVVDLNYETFAVFGVWTWFNLVGGFELVKVGEGGG